VDSRLRPHLSKIQADAKGMVIREMIRGGQSKIMENYAKK
jgi:hypothetical protein